MEQALAHVSAHLGHEYDMVIGGKRLRTEARSSPSIPRAPPQVIGIHQRAEAEHAEPAIEAAHTAFLTWSRTPVADRADLLLRAAAAIRDRNFEFCAWLTLEVGKNWAEADADVGETIDFLEFYAREALRLDQPPPPPSSSPANVTSCVTFPSASAPSSRRGTSPSPSWPA